MNSKRKNVKGKLSSCNKKGIQTYRPLIKTENLEHKDKSNNSIKSRLYNINQDIDTLYKKFTNIQKDKIKLLKDEKVLSNKLNRFKEKRRESLVNSTAYSQLRDNSITKKDLKKNFLLNRKISTKKEFHTGNFTIDLENPKKLHVFGLVRTPNHNNKKQLSINEHNYSYCYSDRNNRSIFHSSKKKKYIKKYNATNSIIINVNNTSIYFQENKIKNSAPVYSSRNYKQNINTKYENSNKINIDMFSSYAISKLGKLPHTNSKNYKQKDFSTNFKKYKNNVKTKILKTEEKKSEKKELSNDENNDFNFSFGKPQMNKKQENLDIDNEQRIINDKTNKESIIIPEDKENIFEDIGCNTKNDECLNNKLNKYVNNEKEEENYKMKKKIYLYEKHREEIMERYNKKFKRHLYSDNLSSKIKLENHLNNSINGNDDKNKKKKNTNKRIIVLRVKKK